MKELFVERMGVLPHEVPDPITIDALSSHGLNSLDVVELLMEMDDRASA